MVRVGRGLVGVDCCGKGFEETQCRNLAWIFMADGAFAYPGGAAASRGQGGRLFNDIAGDVNGPVNAFLECLLRGFFEAV